MKQNIFLYGAASLVALGTFSWAQNGPNQMQPVHPYLVKGSAPAVSGPGSVSKYCSIYADHVDFRDQVETSNGLVSVSRTISIKLDGDHSKLRDDARSDRFQETTVGSIDNTVTEYTSLNGDEVRGQYLTRTLLKSKGAGFTKINTAKGAAQLILLIDAVCK